MHLYRNAFALSVDRRVFEGYGDIAAAVGSREMIPVLDRAISRIDEVVRWYFYEWNIVGDTRGVPSDIRTFAFHHEAGVDDMVSNYINRFVHSDPLSRVLETEGRRRDSLAIALTPDDIPDSLYRERYMQQLGIGQRLSFVHRSESAFFVMNVSRAGRHGALGERAIERLGAFSMLAFPALARHHQLTSDVPSPRIAVADIERAIANRFPDLTQREVQVCSRTIVGHSSKSIARDLAIGKETVLTYRKRAYLRTGLNSIEQLSKAIVN